jgi:hypothetical protein
MAQIILSAIKPALIDLLDRARKLAPGAIDQLFAMVLAWLPSSIDKATAAFRTLYSDIVARVTAWLPAAKPRLGLLVDRVVKWLKVQAGKL